MVALAEVIAYVYTKYRVFPENIFIKYPGISVFRHRDSKKWFALSLSVKTEKIKYDENFYFQSSVTLLNLKLPPGLIVLLKDNKTFLPAYHMNKRNWISVNLDSIDLSASHLYELIDQSFACSKEDSLHAK
ncbi:MAG: MmcQ/YjbR family DNA-binding protein [Campylobacter sp.]|nr:MmcQ/YjbR family DNA-binding protein [Campylobacter sp.]